MAGRGMLADAHDTDLASSSNKRKGLRDRLGSHASGRRSGGQFNVYVFDRLALPTLTQDQISAAAKGELSLDLVTRNYIRNRLSYRFVVTDDGREALALERQIQSFGIGGSVPLLNPRR